MKAPPEYYRNMEKQGEVVVMYLSNYSEKCA